MKAADALIISNIAIDKSLSNVFEGINTSALKGLKVLKINNLDSIKLSRLRVLGYSIHSVIDGVNISWEKK